jgi:hypothetical protein
MQAAMNERESQPLLPPTKLRWHQFSLRSLFEVILIVAVILGLVLEIRSIRRWVDGELLRVSMDQAHVSLAVPLGMADERLASPAYAPALKGVLSRADEGTNGLGRFESVTTWEFRYDTKSSPDSIRRQLRSCIEPVYWLAAQKTTYRWSWTVKHDVELFPERGRGRLSVTAAAH